VAASPGQSRQISAGKNPEAAGTFLAHGQLLPHFTARAVKKNGKLAAFLVKLTDDFQIHRVAFDAGYIKQRTNGFIPGLLWLVILTAHESAGCVHAAKLSDAPDNACPTENFSFGFSYCSGNRRIQFLLTKAKEHKNLA
jgi:hypothetical protein